MNVVTEARAVAFSITAPPKRRKLHDPIPKRFSERMLHPGAIHAPHFSAAVFLIAVPAMDLDWFGWRSHPVIFMAFDSAEVFDRERFKFRVNRLADFRDPIMGIIHDEVVSDLEPNSATHAALPCFGPTGGYAQI